MDEVFDSPPYSPSDQPSSPAQADQPPSPPPPPLTPPPPPPPPQRQPIIIYSQLHHPTQFQPTRYFYDPNTLFNEFAFTLEGNTEYIILIQGIGYEFNDNDIYPAHINLPNGPLVVNEDQEPNSICLLIRHLGPQVNLSVAPRTSLAFLLENARISVRTCYITNVAEFVLRHDHSNIVTEALSAPRHNYLTTYSPYLRTIPTVAQQAASRHPLLLRRLLNLPKRGALSPPQPNSE